jgi:hypothetical protein
VIEAHSVSLDLHPRPRSALVAQTPLVLLMVSYTFAGLWVLGAARRVRKFGRTGKPVFCGGIDFRNPMLAEELRHR